MYAPALCPADRGFRTVCICKDTKNVRFRQIYAQIFTSLHKNAIGMAVGGGFAIEFFRR